MTFEWRPLKEAPKDGSKVLARPIGEEDVSDERLLSWLPWTDESNMQWVWIDYPWCACNERFFEYMASTPEEAPQNRSDASK